MTTRECAAQAAAGRDAGNARLGDNRGMTWSASPRRGHRHWLPIALAVAAAHLLLVGLWQQHVLQRSPQRTSAAPRPPVLVWQRVLPPPPVQRPEAAPAPPAPPPAPARPRPRAVPAPAPEAEVEAEPEQQAAAPAGAAASAPTPAASAAGSAGPATAAASAPGGRLRDAEATRRAIREAARQRSTREMAAEASGASAPLGAQERMAQEIARGAHGDCLKGEFAGAGMGLFSLPFWLLAEVRDKCRR